LETSLERIRARIAKLENSLINLRITESEIYALEGAPTKTDKVQAEPPRKRGRKPKVVTSEAAESGAELSISATIKSLLKQNGPLSVKAMAAHIATAGRDINNRSLSFTLQALKKQGFVRSVAGEWKLLQRRRPIVS